MQILIGPKSSEKQKTAIRRLIMREYRIGGLNSLASFRFLSSAA